MMSALSPTLIAEVKRVLRDAGREDLATKLDECVESDELLTTGQAAELLGVSSRNTVKNWLEAGAFPGAYKTQGGHWRFPRHEVEATLDRMNVLRQKNLQGEASIPDEDEAYTEPPLL